MFDRLVAAARAAGELVILPSIGDDDDAAYAEANQAIIHEAMALVRTNADTRPFRLVAVIVWEGSAREGTDASGGLLNLARQARFEERSILTK